MFKSLNKNISTSTAITVIVLCAVLVGMAIAWQWWMEKKETKAPEIEKPADILQPEKTSPEKMDKLKEPITQLSEETLVCQILLEGSVDIPPLYKEGFTWQEPTLVEEYPAYTLYTELPFKTIKLPGCLIQSTETASSVGTLKVIDFYHNELLKLGWVLIDAADGPGGQMRSYQKNEKYFTVNMFSTAPSLHEVPVSPWQVEVFLSH